jgi:CheY-like chemotaxis protein/predicted regulator of Ras-like GTPase activity (Roadblock/LC7/MglB family)
MAARILVIDRNEAFATMLKEMLESEGEYQVDITASGRHALHLLRQESFDLTIMDTDLDAADMTYGDLVRGVRRLHPSMRIVLIPLMGQELPPDAHRLAIQGALSKPFFADDLLPGIENALQQQVGGSRPAPATTAAPTAPPAGAPSPQPTRDHQAILSDLARETQAQLVCLLSTAGGQSRVIAQTGSLDSAGLETLASLSTTTVSAARAMARFLGQADAPYEHNMFENDESRLYIMALPENLLLVIVTPLRTPLGTIRHNLRRAGRHLGI